MARATYGSIVTDIKGSINGHTYQHNAVSKIVKTRPIHKPKNTIKLMAAQKTFNSLAQSWKALTLVQQVAWSDFGIASPHVNKYNEVKNLTGFNKYLSSNCNRLLCSEAVLPNAPVYAAATVQSPFILNFTASVFQIEFDDIIDCTSESLAIFTSPPTKRTSPKLRSQFVLTEIVNTGSFTKYDFFSSYFAAHGLPSSYFSDPLTFNIAVMCYRIKRSNGVYSIAEFNIASAGVIPPFSPIDISGLVSWHSADVGVTKDGSDYVSEWSDQSIEANNATQPTAANKPLWVDSILNSKPILRFDGVNTGMLHEIASSPAYTFFIVVTPSSSKSAYEISLNMYSAAEIRWGIGMGSDGTQGSGWCGVGAGTGLGNANDCLVNEWKIVAYTKNVADGWNLYRNGSFIRNVADTSIATYLGTKPMGIGAEYITTPNYGLSGDIAEILIYNSVLSTTDRELVQTYLNEKYLIY